jgi:hypothetical protein
MPLLISLLFLLSFHVEARTFKNAYISFEMQDNWKCLLEQTEWVCRAEDLQEAKEATIILTAKERGPNDTYEAYEIHLNTPQQIMGAAGPIISAVKYKAQKKKINDHLWLDSLHGDSEVQYYFTRYMATVKDEIGILVTFSAHNKFYSKHSGNFNKTIQTLRVVASKNFAQSNQEKSLSTNETIGTGFGEGTGFSDIGVGDDSLSDGSGKGIFKNKMVLGFLLILLGIIIYIISKVYGKKP